MWLDKLSQLPAHALIDLAMMRRGRMCSLFQVRYYGCSDLWLCMKAVPYAEGHLLVLHC